MKSLNGSNHVFKEVSFGQNIENSLDMYFRIKHQFNSTLSLIFSFNGTLSLKLLFSLFQNKILKTQTITLFYNV